MENKTLSRALFGVTLVLAIITFYFVYGMMTNGAPDDFDPDQMGVALIEQGEASNANYKEKGMEAFESQLQTIDSHILAGVTYMQVILYIAGGLMIIFLIWGLVTTMMSNLKKAMPSLIFLGITVLAFIWAYFSMGPADASAEIRTTNFWVYGLLFVLIPGAIILVVDLIIGLVKGYSK